MDGVGEEVANHTFAELRRQLASAGPPLEVALADAVWSPLGVVFADELVQRVEASYGATVRSLGATGPEAAMAVNRWVAERTGGRITTLLGPTM
jgi:serine protease inhibitor